MRLPSSGTIDAPNHGRPLQSVHQEQQWREPVCTDAASLSSKVIASRWTLTRPSVVDACSETPEDRHVIGIGLRHTQVTYSVDGRTLASGRLIAGAMHVVAPGRRCAVRFQAPADVLHLQISEQMLGECYEAASGIAHPSCLVIEDREVSVDPGIERLAHALLSHETTGCPFGRLYAETVSLAIVTRVLARHARPVKAKTTRKTASLAKWRLDRAIDYIEANLSQPIALADVANTTGLTRMHFAAQFRAATGYRPHEYLLRRRIERAQDLLARPELTLVDAALSVGFQSQSHFSTVFKRLVGETPSRWRQMHQGQVHLGEIPFARQG
ncbi:MAG TPA: AraC family transcriptional regulator [Pararobbsia sp.]|jgi:AraC-like DNA-binding protein|nr:AraC family transcriptional regulator [Pararobbsia sp.]